MLFYILLLSNALQLQQAPLTSFDERYVQFYTEWEKGKIISLEELDSFFSEVDDLTSYPLYFFIRGKTLAELIHLDLSLKYYFLAEKYIVFEDNEQLLGDKRIELYYNIAFAYLYLGKFDKAETYIKKGKRILEEDLSPEVKGVGEFYLKEVEALVLFEKGEEVYKAIDQILQLYYDNKDNQKLLNFLPQTMLLRAIEFYKKIEDYEKMKRALDLFEKDNNYTLLDPYYIIWFLNYKRGYFEVNREYQKALAVNQELTLYYPQISNLFKKELYKANARIYDSINRKEIANRYKDSLIQIKDQEIDLRKTHSLDLTEENQKYDALVTSLSQEKKTQRLFWGGLSLALLIGSWVSILFFRKRKNKAEQQMQLAVEKQKQWNQKYHELLKNFKFDQDHQKRVLQSVETEISKHPTPILNKVLKDSQNQSIDLSHFDITQFETTFKANLKQQLPDLSAFELHLSYYFKLNFTVKEIATLTNRTHRAIEGHLYRIRKKYAQDHSGDFKEFLIDIPFETDL